MNLNADEPPKKVEQEKTPVQLPPMVDFKDLTNGEDSVVLIRLEDGSIYRLQKTRFGKLLLSK